MFELNNFWLLLIWLFTIGVLLRSGGSKYEAYVFGQRQWRWSVLSTCVLLFPYLMWAAYRSDNIGDTLSYRYRFLHGISSWSELIPTIKESEKEKGYEFINAFLHIVLGNKDKLFFGIIAFVQLVLIFSIYRQFSEDLWLSLFLFVASATYVSGMFNGLRQFLSSAICFFALKYLLNKRYAYVFAMLLIAILIHQSAIIMIPIFFIAQGKAWNKKTIAIIILAFLAITFVGDFTNWLGVVTENTIYSGVTTGEIWQADDGVSPIRVAISAVPMLIALFGKKKTEEIDSPLINICVNMSIITFGLYLVGMVTSGIFLGRLPMYTYLYNYILLPWEVNHVFREGSRRLVYILMLFFYTIVFYVEMF